ncbi:glycosyltransferase family 2 protein [Flavobacterium sp. KACC 22761]|uniref:glycosyltransferase family 2 protein n=1 Tax=Flavobacterium sp. KACC 22761 TaxID=3092665 RepID=UPI002A752336|nr:glycosyltransferase family 2 protein [Flavobacterium sp. KACC 22761]WPO79501.1 glycosyltransferase family 2 protein [Flavobacterium sp. KACC 22761]
MKTAVVIATYNPLKWIEKCLDSLIQSTISVEILIIDNNSTDGFQEILKSKYPQIMFVQSSSNLGFGAANNIGIRKAYNNDADFVFLLNQDAWVQPDTIEKLISAQQKQPEYGIISPMHLNGKGDELDYNFSNYIIPYQCKKLYSDIYLNKIQPNVYQVSFVNAAGWLLSRKCIELVGGFNPSFFHYGEDDNYVERVHFHGMKVGILAITELFHDRDEVNKSVYFHDSQLIYKRKILLKASNPFNQFSFELENKKLYKFAARALLSFRFKLFLKIKVQIQILNSLDKKGIISRRNESRNSNLSFLN